MTPVAKRRNPPWTYDELVLALDLYIRRGLPNASDPEVIELSGVLNSLRTDRTEGALHTLRNPNGVYLKLCNFRAKERPGHGMAHGNHLEFDVWDRFANKKDELHRLANSIRASRPRSSTVVRPPPEMDVAPRQSSLANLGKGSPISGSASPMNATSLLMTLIQEAAELNGLLTTSIDATAGSGLSAGILQSRVSRMQSLLAKLVDSTIDDGATPSRNADQERSNVAGSVDAPKAGTLLIFPCGDPGSAKHFNRTVRRPVDLTAVGLNFDQLSKVLPPDYPLSKARVWGIMPRGSGLNESRFRRSRIGDVGLFTGKGRAFAAATVRATFQSKELAQALWHTDGSGRTWELIFLLSEPIDLVIPYEVLNRALGYDSKFAFHAFFVLPESVTLRARPALEAKIGQLWASPRSRSIFPPTGGN